MDKLRDKLDNGEKINHMEFENIVCKDIMKNRDNIDYHFC